MGPPLRVTVIELTGPSFTDVPSAADPAVFLEPAKER